MEIEEVDPPIPIAEVTNIRPPTSVKIKVNKNTASRLFYNI